MMLNSTVRLQNHLLQSSSDKIKHKRQTIRAKSKNHNSVLCKALKSSKMLARKVHKNATAKQLTMFS